MTCPAASWARLRTGGWRHPTTCLARLGWLPLARGRRCPAASTPRGGPEASPLPGRRLPGRFQARAKAQRLLPAAVAALLAAVLPVPALPVPAGVAAPARQAPTTAAVCAQASTTLQLQACLEAELERLDRQLRRYLEAAQRREDQLAAADGRPVVSLAASQRLWRIYREAYCRDLYRHWSGGSIRGVMALSCRQALARERLRRLWADFLTFADGSPPLLPDPDPDAAGGRSAPSAP